MILNGTDKPINNKLSKIEARKKMAIPLNCFCLVFVGNIYHEYDFLTILKAVSESKKNIPHINLIIIGNGPLLDLVKKTVDKMEISKNVIFTGYIPEKKLGKILPAADIGLLLRTKKGVLRYGPVSTKLATYISYKLPVVTAGWSLKDYPDELARGLYLVPPENPSVMSDKIFHIYKNSKERSEKAKILYDYATEKLTWNTVTKEILDLFKQNMNV
jgi:glycosyltransferase involved in cell wall biosynthesis